MLYSTYMLEDAHEVQGGESTPEAVDIGEDFFQRSIQEHEKFDNYVWKSDNPERRSFHDAEHIKAVYRASDKVDEAYIDGTDRYTSGQIRKVDPFSLMEDIKKWNEEHAREYNVTLSLELFRDIRRAAVAEHDKGNIMTEDEKYRDRYKAEGAEEVAKELFERRINQSNLSDLMKKVYKDVGSLLIEATKFDFAMEEKGLFKRYMAAVDQIGNDIESNNEHRLEGLAEEQKAEGVDDIDPDFFENFALYRMQTIIPDENKRKLAWEIFGKKPHKKSHPRLQEKMPVDEYIAYRQKIKRAREIINSIGGEQGLTAEVEERLRNEDIDLDVVLGEIRGYKELTPENDQ